MDTAAILSIVLCVVFPFLARYGERSGLFPSWLSSIIACYLIGIVVSNTRLWPIDAGLLEQVAGGAMLLGLPLLLFAVRVRESLRYAGPMLLGFCLCCVGGLVCTAFVGYAMTNTMPDAWKVAGMLVGLYTGGTPNVQAIGLALAAPAEYLVLIQAADVLLGGSILLGLITFLPRVFGYFYRKSETGLAADASAFTERVPFLRQLPQLLTGLGVTAISLGICYLVTGGIGNLTALILILTTLSLLVASSTLGNRIGNTYPLGEYFILIFCVALGLMADFRELAASGMELLLFSALALGSTTLLHLLLCKLFDLDRDTVILSYVAGFYGPVFVVQVAAALKNQRLLAAGIAVSLLGFGIGNYLGIGLAYFVAWLHGY